MKVWNDMSEEERRHLVDWFGTRGEVDGNRIVTESTLAVHELSDFQKDEYLKFMAETSYLAALSLRVAEALGWLYASISKQIDEDSSFDSEGRPMNAEKLLRSLSLDFNTAISEGYKLYMSSEGAGNA